jgi:hypothetical protein
MLDETELAAIKEFDLIPAINYPKLDAQVSQPSLSQE